MEHLRFNHCLREFSRYNIRVGRWSKCSSRSSIGKLHIFLRTHHNSLCHSIININEHISIVASFKIGSIVDNNESASQYNYFNDRCTWKFNAYISDSHLYIRRYRYAIILERLHTRQILSRSSTKVLNLVGFDLVE